MSDWHGRGTVGVSAGGRRSGWVPTPRESGAWLSLPTSPVSQKGGCSSRCLGHPSRQGGGKARWTHLRGECRLPPRPRPVTRRQRRARRDCSPASPVFPARPRAFSASEEDARRGGLCIQARSPRATWPAQRALLSRGASGLQLAVGSPALGGSCVPGHRRSL